LIEAAVRDHTGNKIVLINQKVQYLLENIFKLQDDGNLKYYSLDEIALKLGKTSFKTSPTYKQIRDNCSAELETSFSRLADLHNIKLAQTIN